MITEIIVFDHVKKLFHQPMRKKKICALEDFSLTIEKGKIFGLLGPNGSGKTTAIKLMLGLLRPNNGSVKVFGCSVQSMHVKERVGYMPEETQLYPFLTGRETLDFYAKLSGVKITDMRQRVQEVLSIVGLSDASDRQVKQYSKGMLRRLGLALVLIKDPDLLVLDEPTIGMDPLAVQDFKRMLIKLREQGKTVILSSHLLGEIENVCDEVVILYQGKMLQKGSLDEILKLKDLLQVTIRSNGKLNQDKLNQDLGGLGYQVTGIDHPRKTLERAFVEILNLEEKK